MLKAPAGKPRLGEFLFIKIFGESRGRGASSTGISLGYKTVLTKNLRWCPDLAYEVGGLMGPVTRFGFRDSAPCVFAGRTMERQEVASPWQGLPGKFRRFRNFRRG